MDKRWMIYAYEGLYGGLHGCYLIEFIKGTYQEAEDLGRELSYEVMDSYSDIDEELWSDCETEEEYYQARDENVEFEIHELRDDAPSARKLHEMNHAPEWYIEEYCVQ